MTGETIHGVSLAEERFKLEREAFELERSRLQAARERAEAELERAKSRHPFLVVSSVVLLALVSFAGGMLYGISSNESRHQKMRDARLKEALAQLGGATDAVQTNRLTITAGSKPDSARNVSVVVFQ